MSSMDASFKSTMSSTGAAKGPGVKRTVDRLEHSVMQQAEVIARHEKEILQTGEDAVELVRGLEARMKAAIQDLRTEFLQKLSVVTNEITQMQKQINVQKGEGNILAQQNKEANRRILEVAEQVQELSLELLGDPVGAAGAAHAP